MVRIRVLAILSLCSSAVLLAQKPLPPAGADLASPPSTTPEARWKQDADAREASLTARFGPGTDEELRTHLIALAQADRQARGLVPGSGGKATPVAALHEGDVERSAQLRSLIEVHGWPTVALVGVEASNAAMLVLTHTPDHAWQRALLPLLEELADAGKIDAAPLALVVDKELVSEGKLQRYGTQFRLVKGAMAMDAVEDPAGLDKRRERLLLPPLSVYKAMLSRMYHLPASDGIAGIAQKSE